MTTFAPTDAADLRDIVAGCAADRETVEIMAGGSKRGYGRPVRAEHTLDLSRVTGVIDYDPPELVLTAHAATPMSEIGALLDAQRQMLAFEPPDWRALLRSEAAATLGGVVACNAAGPRRVRAGAARDHFLGFSAVNGRGDAWKAGGRVVKNVTGYDLCKVQAGAFGTLSVLTEISVRVLPRPETSCSLVLHDLDDDTAIATLSRALNTPHEVSAAAHIPGASPRTVLRLEGPAPSVAFRAAALQALLGEAEQLDAGDSDLLWADIAGVAPLLQAAVIWRVNPTPAAAAAVLRDVRARHLEAAGLYDWGGGLLWIALEESDDAGESAVRGAVARVGGHATLMVARDELRTRIPVFPPQPAPLAALSRRIRDSFDPLGILNPGRMTEGQ